MPLQADSLGQLSGSFVIPPGVPAGVKEVSFRGLQGSFGQTAFVGRGTIVNEVRRSVTEIRIWRWWVRSDPLAQTFTLTQARIIGGLDLWFTAKGGGSPVIAQIRETEVGLPGPGILTEGIIEAADIVTDGNATRCVFRPVPLEANREYAIVLLTDDAEHAVAVAELGKYDPASGWVTAQPYQIGVLLSSSNASTWTPHQDRDLAFRLLACAFTAPTRDVALGSINGTNVSDMLLLAGIERPAPGTDAEFILQATNGEQFRLGETQNLAVQAKLSDSFDVTLRLVGDTNHSPIVYPHPQIVFGEVADSGDYVSRAIPADTTFAITVTLEALLPGTSSLTVEAEDVEAEQWTALPLDSATPVGDGWVEQTFKATTLNGVGLDNTTRVRLTLDGSAQYRPHARNLRAVVT